MGINGKWDKRKGLPGVWTISGYRKGLYGLPEEQGRIVIAILGRTDAFTGLPKGADKAGRAVPKFFDTVSRPLHLHHKKILAIPIRSYGCSRWVFRCKEIKAYRSRFRIRGT